MTNTQLLGKKIAESGYKKQFIAAKAKITYQAFLNKLNNRSEFRASEIQAICLLLNISSEERDLIFFQPM